MVMVTIFGSSIMCVVTGNSFHAVEWSVMLSGLHGRLISGDGWLITLELVYMSSVVMCQNTASCFTLPLMLYTHKHCTCGIM